MLAEHTVGVIGNLSKAAMAAVEAGVEPTPFFVAVGFHKPHVSKQKSSQERASLVSRDLRLGPDLRANRTHVHTRIAELFRFAFEEMFTICLTSTTAY
jgi:hypothetical protein